MRKVLCIVLALLFVFSFGVAAFAAGDGSGTGGGNGDGSGGGNVNPYDATVDGAGTLTIVCAAGSSTYDIDSVTIPFSITTYPTGGFKHLDASNLSQTINASTTVLTCNGSVVSGFSPVLTGVYGADRNSGGFSIYINSSYLKEGSSYTLTIKAGASWENQPKNHAVLGSDYSYSFSVAGDAAPVETTTAESKQSSPLTTKKSSSDKNGTTKAAASKDTQKGETTTAGEATTADETTKAAKTNDKGVKTNDKSAKTNTAATKTGEVKDSGSKGGIIAAAVVTAIVIPSGAAVAIRKIKK